MELAKHIIISPEAYRRMEIELMEKATESNVSNTGKTRNEWWRKRREEPRKVRAKISHETVVKRRQKAAARQKDERYAAALDAFFAASFRILRSRFVAKNRESAAA